MSRNMFLNSFFVMEKLHSFKIFSYTEDEKLIFKDSTLYWEIRISMWYRMLTSFYYNCSKIRLYTIRAVWVCVGFLFFIHCCFSDMLLANKKCCYAWVLLPWLSPGCFVVEDIAVAGDEDRTRWKVENLLIITEVVLIRKKLNNLN